MLTGWELQCGFVKRQEGVMEVLWGCVGLTATVTHTHAHARTHTRTYEHTHAWTHTHEHARALARAHTHIYINIYMSNLCVHSNKWGLGLLVVIVSSAVGWCWLRSRAALPCRDEASGRPWMMMSYWLRGWLAGGPRWSWGGCDRCWVLLQDVRRAVVCRSTRLCGRAVRRYIFCLDESFIDVCVAGYSSIS